ncbi:DNA repair protein recA homolog 3- mitochondrial [Striga hermonthica]|uniref:DNA repair protein recA homolog 3- mitochondrial n=1 Tax=Striga hermonthica TaxID=68872 RepID=A0A9N7P0K7_STRHE|nr:DNA repair protein recA homolog 3- mitochondrial [Striga hermonthica]
MARLLRNASSLRRSLFPHLQEPRRGLLGTSTQMYNFSAKAKKKTKSSASDSADENLSKKDLALKQALDQITASFGKGSIMWLGRTVSYKNTPVVSTGSFALDVALGVGGLPKGRVVEIYGPEASGKTTLALHVIAEAQKQGGYCVFVDAEHALDPSLAEAIGVNTQNLLLSQPDCGEQALSLVDTLIRSGSVDVVVVDSVAALVPKGELDGEMGDAHMAMQARLMSQALRKLSHSLSLSQTILIFTNQAWVRAKLSTFGFGGPSEVTCGGNALKFYASVRLNVRRTGLVKKGEETIGSQVVAKIVKNKHAPPFRTAEFELEFGRGICREAELIDLGVKHKFIKKAGAFLYLGEQNFQGKDALKRYLSENESASNELMNKLREKLVDTEPESENESVTGSVDEVASSDSTDEEPLAAAVEA